VALGSPPGNGEVMKTPCRLRLSPRLSSLHHTTNPSVTRTSDIQGEPVIVDVKSRGISSANVNAGVDSRLLQACRREPSSTIPVWLMRQAGRYLPQFQVLQEKYGFAQLIRTPELACEVTMMPVRAFRPDAAIIFADIIPLLEGLGLKVDMPQGQEPVVRHPLRSAADVDRLQAMAPEESMGYTLEAIRLVRREMETTGIPIIGFSGAPFTLACYAIEGGHSSTFSITRAFMMSQQTAWRQLMTKLSGLVAQSLLAQVRAGAQVLQLFDSWVGLLSPMDYRNYVSPYTRRVISTASKAGVPIIHFGTGNAGFLEQMRDAGADVVGIDWRIDLDVAWRRIGKDFAVQGNLDPAALLAPWDELKRQAQCVLNQALAVHNDAAGYIFNLGHGVLPATPPENVQRLVDFVHEYPLSGGQPS
jgi:uroporphyrinogen decarboxylase